MFKKLLAIEGKYTSLSALIAEHPQHLGAWALLILAISFVPVLALNDKTIALFFCANKYIIYIVSAVLFLWLTATVVKICFVKNIVAVNKLRSIVVAYGLLIFIFANCYYCIHAMHGFEMALHKAYPTDKMTVELEDPYAGKIAQAWIALPAAARDNGDRVKPSNQTHVYFDCFYLSVATITTTGYGDITPLTPLTRLISCLEMLSGQTIVVLALGMWFSSRNK
ncbi:MAG: potassium channel family protein [Deltaproteobacteria bacterium]